MFSLFPHQPHPFLIHPFPKLPLSLDGQKKSSIEVISVTGNNCFKFLFCFSFVLFSWLTAMSAVQLYWLCLLLPMPQVFSSLP